MALDWKNMDWSALLHSQVVIGSVVTVITSICAIVGHALPPEMQTNLVNGLTQLFSALATLSGLYTAYHRVAAQPDGQTVIVPKKDQPQTGDKS